MRHSVKIFAGLVCFSLVFSQRLQAAEPASPGTPARKFQRGILNIAFSPVEITADLEEEKKKPGRSIPTWFWGLTGGTVNMGIRAVIGLYEVITFPIDWPREHKPIYHPEFALDRLPPAPDAVP